MSWLREAGGFWVSPEDPQTSIPVDSHAPYALDVLRAMVMTPEEEDQLLKQYISQLEQTKPVGTTTPSGEDKVEYKSEYGGEEAKAKALEMVEEEKQKRLIEKYNVSNGMGAAMTLQDLGWVRIGTDEPSMLMIMGKDDASILAAENAILAEAQNYAMISIYVGHADPLFIQYKNITTNLADAMAAARAPKKPAPTAPTAEAAMPVTTSTGGLDISGLGPWRIAGACREVSFRSSVRVEHRPSNPQGRQWCVLSSDGRVLASGVSRKWAERSARKIDWQRRNKT